MKAGYSEGLVSVVVNTALFLLKLWAGVVSGSIALMADAWHTLSDSISSIVVMLAVRLSGRKADKAHPFGYGRWEHIGALFVGFFLAVVAYTFIVEAVDRLQNGQQAEYGAVAVWVTVVSIIGKEALAQYAFSLARKTGNVSIKADGWHHRSDALSSIVVLIGIFVGKQIWWIDGAMAIVVAIMLMHATYVIVRECIDKLLGEKPSQEMIDQIGTLIKGVYDGDLMLHHVHIHNYVTAQELTMHIKLPPDMTIEQGHEIATRIECIIANQMGMVATVHVEPLSVEHERD